MSRNSEKTTRLRTSGGQVSASFFNYVCIKFFSNTRIHTYGNKFCVTDHPDGRAVLYESKTYSKRKIIDLLKTLRGFETSQEINSIFNGYLFSHHFFLEF